MANDIIDKYSDVWGDDPRRLLDEYTYQPTLTRKLDALDPGGLTTGLLHEIVLWKLNRYPAVSEDLILQLRTVGAVRPREHRKSKAILTQLLQSQGIALAMASTVLRFLNPAAFQIIDDRAFRIVCPGERKYPTKPAKINDMYLDNCAEIYFDYLDKLHALASDRLPFSSADRILYMLDIKLGNRIGDAS